LFVYVFSFSSHLLPLLSPRTLQGPYFLETGSCCEGQVASNSLSSCLSLPYPGIAGVVSQAWLLKMIWLWSLWV
jgi:hypothetical protein